MDRRLDALVPAGRPAVVAIRRREPSRHECHEGAMKAMKEGSMSADTNKSAVRRFLGEAFDKGNLAAVDELIAEDFVDHNPPPKVRADKTGLKQTVTLFRSAFPDLRLTVEDMIAEGDKVAVRIVSRGTHKGELMGIAPTGRSIAVNEEHILRLANGKIAEHWGVEDNLSMMQQLGVVHAP
jgi:steroid delta-isomerase-like uncharacterized protein